MNFKEFLIDNYIWILVVVLLTVVTIIGFLVDKKKNGSKNAAANTSMAPNLGPVSGGQPQQASNVNQIPSPGFNNNMGMVVPTPVNSQPLMNQSNGNIPSNMVMPNNNQMASPISQTVPQPVSEPSNMNDGFVYQPLADQTPKIAPQPIPAPMPNVVPEPVPNVTSNNVQPSIIGQPNFQSNMNSEPQLQVIPQQIEQPQQMQQPQPAQINIIPTSVPATPINQQPNMVDNNFNNGMFNQTNMYQNPTSQQMMGLANNVQPPIQQSNVPVNNTPNVIPSNNASPVSFVFGPQNGGQN